MRRKVYSTFQYKYEVRERSLFFQSICYTMYYGENNGKLP